MEPTPVLVSAFKVKVGEAIGRAIGAVAQHECVSRARVEPHVEYVIDLVIIVRVNDALQHLFLESLHKPDIGAVSLKRSHNARIHFGVAQQEVRIGRFCAFFGKAGQRHAPRALAR